MPIPDVYLYSLPSGNDVRLRSAPSGGSIQGTMALTLDDVAFAASATAGHVGSMAAALDDIVVAAASTAGHTVASAMTLADVTPAITATAGRLGPLSVVLDSIAAAALGTSGRSGASSLVLDGIAFSAAAASAASAAGGGSYGASPKRYVRKIGNRLVTFRSLQAAVSAVDVAPNKPEETKQPQPVVVEKVNVATNETMAKQHDSEAAIMNMFRAAEYDRIMALVDDWRREEEDVELLLFSA